MYENNLMYENIEVAIVFEFSQKLARNYCVDLRAEISNSRVSICHLLLIFIQYG